MIIKKGNTLKEWQPEGSFLLTFLRVGYVLTLHLSKIAHAHYVVHLFCSLNHKSMF
jgi:hypothetical protein